MDMEAHRQHPANGVVDYGRAPWRHRAFQVGAPSCITHVGPPT
jgi:hypothetical protein